MAIVFDDGRLEACALTVVVDAAEILTGFDDGMGIEWIAGGGGGGGSSGGGGASLTISTRRPCTPMIAIWYESSEVR